MIVIPRGLVRTFRAVARKCSAGSSRGPRHAVVVRAAHGRLTLMSRCPEAVLLCEAEAPGGACETVVVPLEVFDAIDTPSAMELSGDGSTGVIRWTDRSGPRETPFDALRPDAQAEPPERPDRLGSVPPDFLTALHECGRTTGPEPTRFAIHRVQVRGEAGQVIGTDGKQALSWGGFRFPFPDDVLIPAIPAFGTKALAAEPEILVGRTDAHLVIAAGPWTAFLPRDTQSRFPDVAGAIPKSRVASVLDLGETDAGHLLDRQVRWSAPPRR